ncbi:Vesicle transport protein S20 [Coemansia sp. RSA 2704]|nr:Vesicle transport protein S20 [Coemansia sp. RSA 2704]
MPEESSLLTEWLAQLDGDLDAVEQDIQQLHAFSGGRNEHQQLADSVREQQRGAQRLLERLSLESLDASPQEQRLKQLQRTFRAALLQYRSNKRAEARHERELLLSGAATASELRKKKARTGDAALNAAADVTTALQETVSMMNDEIEKSAANVGAMQESSDRLRKAKGQYVLMDDVLKLSKSLVKTLEQADTVDRWLMLGGLVLFSLVAFNILRKRVWIPGLSTFFWILRYVFTLGMGKSEPAESPLISSELTAVFATTTTAVIDTLSVSTAAPETMTLEPTLSVNAMPSIEVLDTLTATMPGARASEKSQAESASQPVEESTENKHRSSSSGSSELLSKAQPSRPRDSEGNSDKPSKARPPKPMASEGDTSEPSSKAQPSKPRDPKGDSDKPAKAQPPKPKIPPGAAKPGSRMYRPPVERPKREEL